MNGEMLLYSPQQAAQLLGYGRSQVFELIARGELESFKEGRLRKIPAAALTDYIERKMRKQSA
jgi:excisionase family DNA binding protein